MRKDVLPPPGPGEAHPAYSAEDVAAIRAWLDRCTSNHFMIGPPGGLAVVYDCETQAEAEATASFAFHPETRFFHRAWAVTPAPWAERPYAYRYAVAIDDLGRSVAGVNAYPTWTEDIPDDLMGRLLGAILGHTG